MDTDNGFIDGDYGWINPIPPYDWCLIGDGDSGW